VSQTHHWTVTPEENGVRLDALLAHRLPSFSRRERTALIATRQVLVNGRAVPKGTTVFTNDQVTVSLTDRLSPQPTLPIGVIYADDEIVVVDKPVGLASVALRHSDTHTVANFLVAHFPDTTSAGPRQLEAGLVHRLDTDTSGLLLASRTPSAYAELRRQFQAHAVQKTYHAIVKGRVELAGRIDCSLASSGVRGQRMRVVATLVGQEALTVYAPVRHLPEHTVLQVTIVTGVRHQIRAHLAALGHPIVGDTLYGGAPLQPDTRLCLHAETLTLRHPRTDRDLCFTSPPPEDFSSILEHLQAQATSEQ
jgi:23S rRNA pseudouridine1911/1915/1917 synthase